MEDLYKLMTEKKLPATQDQKDQFEKLQSVRSQLQTSLSLSEASLADNTARFTKELETEVPRLKKKIAATAKKLDDEKFSNAEQDLDPIFEALDDIALAMREMEANSKRFAYYQTVLQIEPEQYEDLGTLKQDFDIRNSLWRSLREWDQWTEKWLVDIFADIRTDDIARETQKYMKVIRYRTRAGWSKSDGRAGIAHPSIASFVLTENHLIILVRASDLFLYHAYKK